VALPSRLRRFDQELILAGEGGEVGLARSSGARARNSALSRPELAGFLLFLWPRRKRCTSLRRWLARQIGEPSCPPAQAGTVWLFLLLAFTSAGHLTQAHELQLAAGEEKTFPGFWPGHERLPPHGPRAGRPRTTFTGDRTIGRDRADVEPVPGGAMALCATL